MFDLDKWQEIFGMMRRNKLRTILTALGVFWGIFMLILLLGAGQGFQNAVVRSFQDEAINSMFIWQGSTSMPSHGLQPGRRILFTDQDLDMLKKSVEEIESIAPRNGMWQTSAVKYNDKTAAIGVFGSTHEFLSINGEKLNTGRLLNAFDDMEKRKVAIIGQKAKEMLFGKDSTAVGEYVEIQGVFFKIVGIFNAEGNGGRNEERIYLPFGTQQQTFGQMNEVHLIAVTTKANSDPKIVEQKIRKVLAKSHRFNPDDKQAIGVNSNEENFKRIMNVFLGIKLFVGVVGFMTLIAGIIGVSNIMLIIVKERTKEIGVRKALGATPHSIVNLILQESIVITTLSGYLGLLVGAGCLELMRWMIDAAEAQSGQRVEFFYKPEVDLVVGFGAIVVLVIFGAIAGLVPAMKAANIKPIEALKAD
jgi:putative ABC transport system permease protein